MQGKNILLLELHDLWYSDIQIGIYWAISSKALKYQVFLLAKFLNCMNFPLFFPLWAETRESFYFSLATLSKSLAEDRLASLVE